MTRRDKAIALLLRGNADANISFPDLVAILKAVGFEERIRGDHHNFYKGRRSGNLEFAASPGQGEAISGETSPQRADDVPAGIR